MPFGVKNHPPPPLFNNDRSLNTHCISLQTWVSCNLPKDLKDSYIRVARLIHNTSPSVAKHEVLSKAKWNSLSSIYKRRLACIAYQTRGGFGGMGRLGCYPPPSMGSFKHEIIKKEQNYHWFRNLTKT